MCVDTPGGWHSSVEALGPDTAANAEPGDRGESAFAVELGRGLRDPDGFILVPFLRSDGQATRAGFVSGHTTATFVLQETDLGPVVGAGGPPRVALSPQTLYVALDEGDATGGSYRLGQLSRSAGGSVGAVHWFATVDADSDDSRAFDLAYDSAAGALLLVHDAWDRSRHRAQVWLERLDDKGGSRRVQVGAEWDSEMPLFAPGRSGVWLGFATVEPTSAEMTAGQPGAEPEVFDEGKRSLRVVRVGADGSLGEPLLVPTGGESVQSFDLSAGHDDSLIVAWRAHGGPAGGGGGVLGVTRVGADGASTEFEVDAPAVTSGAPLLLFDPDPGGGGPHGWLVVEGALGETQLAALGPDGRPLEALAPDPTLAAGVPLSAFRGELLIARARGRAATLSRVRCLDTEVVVERGDAATPR